MLVEKQCIDQEATKNPLAKAFGLGFLKKIGTQKTIFETPVSHGDVNMDLLEKKLKKGEIDVEYLNQTLKPDCEYMLEDERLFFGDDE